MNPTVYSSFTTSPIFYQSSNTIFSRQSSSFYSTEMSLPYPTAPEITAIFAPLAEGNPAVFFALVSPTVHWTVMGTHPLAGTYTDLERFQKATFARLGAIMKDDDPIKLEVVNVVGGGGQEWAVTELKARGTCKNGLRFGNRYA